MCRRGRKIEKGVAVIKQNIDRQCNVSEQSRVYVNQTNLNKDCLCKADQTKQIIVYMLSV